jgi:O-antigen ligase
MRVIFWVLVATVVLAPLPFASNRPWSWSLLALVAGLLMSGWAVLALLDPRRIAVPFARVAPPAVAFLLLLGLFALQIAPWSPSDWHHPLWGAASAALGRPLPGAISLDPAATAASAMRLSAYGAIFWLALQTARDRDRARAALWAVVLAGFGYSTYGLAVDFSGANTVLWFERWAYEDSVTSTFVNRNAFATFAGITLIASLGLLLDEARRAGRAGSTSAATIRRAIEFLSGRGSVLLVAALAAGWALLGSESRGGLVSLVFALVVLTGLRALGREVSAARVIAEAAAVASLGLVVVHLGGDVALDRLARTVLDEEQRIAVYRDLVAAIEARPWTGLGLGAFASTFPLVRDAGLVDAGTYQKAHNGYLEWAFEGGLPALVLLVLALGGAWLRCVRGAAARHRDAHYPAIAAAATVLVAVHALIDFGPQTPAVAALFALLLGLGCAHAGPVKRPSDAPARS